MESTIVIVILRLIHVLASLFWVGGTLLMTFFVLPTSRRLGPTGGAFMGSLMGKSGLAVVLSITGLLTLASGILLYWDFYADAPWSVFGPHVLFGIGGVFAVVAFVAGAAIGPSTSKRLGALGARLMSQGTPPSPEQIKERGILMGRLTGLAYFNSGVLALAAALMAVARYV